jgi:ribosomal-protein-alanine N-acetyltransferase
MIIETRRLLLREFVLEDAEAVYQIQSDPDVMRYTGEAPLPNVDAARDMLAERPLADYARCGFGRWACVLKGTGEVIGGAGLKYLPELDDVDLGYRLRRDYWGQGLATEAARACVEYGFGSLKLRWIIGLVEAENAASVRVLEKTGFRFEGEVEYRGEVVAKYVLPR